MGYGATTEVPRPATDWMDNAPFTKRSRSRMLIKPNPRRFIVSCQSNPIPESFTVKTDSSFVPYSSTVKCLPALCFTAFCSAS